MEHIYSWSGGKDSTATIILAHEYGLPVDEIIFSEVMFDNERKISGELPEHIEFVKNIAIPIFESWGYKVTVLQSVKDYKDLFYHKLTKSRHPERNGKLQGFPIAGRCCVNGRCKVKSIKDYLKGKETTQYIGIASDEPKRLEKLNGTNKISLLKKYNFTEKQAYELCEKYGLLGPIYKSQSRGGCWFCPNQTLAQFANLKMQHPNLWCELKRFAVVAHSGETVSECFQYNKTFFDVETLVDKKINEIKHL